MTTEEYIAELKRKSDLEFDIWKKKHEKKKHSAWWLLLLPLLAFSKPRRRTSWKRMSKFF
jgi:hypothetical protein